MHSGVAQRIARVGVSFAATGRDGKRDDAGDGRCSCHADVRNLGTDAVDVAVSVQMRASEGLECCNQQVVCSSHITSSIKKPCNSNGYRVFSLLWSCKNLGTIWAAFGYKMLCDVAPALHQKLKVYGSKNRLTQRRFTRPGRVVQRVRRENVAPRPELRRRGLTGGCWCVLFRRSIQAA